MKYEAYITIRAYYLSNQADVYLASRKDSVLMTISSRLPYRGLRLIINL